ncbi:hypothetical protein BCR44DRAFT_1500608 [Catenaria anguillulae PL171]|uniref:Uncharacterized protein n=1 Tax=Catenaria anguillulae PL171 TaxID=765915 RepID=A0A1Y2HJJ9_9FUNG|nr:hypothetical protein BCR44DRAFT_51981 [Catenaria anguillulae PL171]ORZ34144.1 hypothetical protein BCR44DRAFT_1500608 [Catenaria anguillulae PL171]
MSNASRMPASPPTPSSTSKRRHPYSTSHHSPRAVPSRTPHPYPDDLESRLASLLNKIDRALPASPRTPSCSGIHPSRASDSCHGHPLPPPPTTRADCATPRPPVVLGTGLVRTEKGDPEAAHHPDGELVEATQSRFSTSLSLNTYDSNEEDLFTTIDNLADSQLCGASREPQLAQSPGSFFARKSLPLGSLVDGQAPLHLRVMIPTIRAPCHIGCRRQGPAPSSAIMIEWILKTTLHRSLH